MLRNLDPPCDNCALSLSRRRGAGGMTDATMKDAEGAEKKTKKGEKKADKEPVKELSEKELIASMEVPALLKKCVAP